MYITSVEDLNDTVKNRYLKRKNPPSNQGGLISFTNHKIEPYYPLLKKESPYFLSDVRSDYNLLFNFS